MAGLFAGTHSVIAWVLWIGNEIAQGGHVSLSTHKRSPRISGTVPMHCLQFGLSAACRRGIVVRETFHSQAHHAQVIPGGRRHPSSPVSVDNIRGLYSLGSAAAKGGVPTEVLTLR
jgi:hypothetical protein